MPYLCDTSSLRFYHLLIVSFHIHCCGLWRQNEWTCVIVQILFDLTVFSYWKTFSHFELFKQLKVPAEGHTLTSRSLSRSLFRLQAVVGAVLPARVDGLVTPHLGNDCVLWPEAGYQQKGRVLQDRCVFVRRHILRQKLSFCDICFFVFMPYT